MNDAGDYCGNYSLGSDFSGFVNIGKVFYSFSIPDAEYLETDDINNSNEAVGWYYTETGSASFLRDSQGNLTYPLTAPGFEIASFFGLDDTGRMVGIAANSDGTGAAAVLVLSPTEVAQYNYPGALYTVFTGINSNGLICGYWSDANGNSHALILSTTITE